MEPNYEGFCDGCNCYSDHLHIRIVRNNNTGNIETRRFCTECMKRFRLFPYDNDNTEDPK